MWVPAIQGVIERRLLINYRVEPNVLAGLLPKPFRPQVHAGKGLAGICLIRLGRIRPRWFPGWIGIGSENAAHRVAVEWEDGDGETRKGVYIFRRDTDSCLNVLAGGRVFPGVHSRSAFRTSENAGQFRVAVVSRDGGMNLHVAGKKSESWPVDSIFHSLEEASAFFHAGSVGYSPGRSPGDQQGLELRCSTWNPKALEIEYADSSLFGNERIFPRGSIQLDCGLVMQRVEHEWHARPAPGYAAAGSGSSAVRDSITAA